MRTRPFIVAVVIAFAGFAATISPIRAEDTSRGDKMLADYFESETAELQNASLKDWDYSSPAAWKAEKAKRREELFEMLGLDPLPEKTDLKPIITGTLERDGVRVQNIQFQSRPGLYVTGNVYSPIGDDSPKPTVLYVCGHGRVKIDGVDYGNKVHYHHHGVWFAKHGYVCLMIDTLQLGEIEGIHHGTYSKNMWWWLNRGYTPAGVEAWNCVRALDYLETRPDVDADRMGVTGRSGGGAYSWWITAIDERIKASVPVAGITDLRNHVVDGCVEGHCDCMFMVNTYRWDYPEVAALAAPRALLLSNTDRDGIFPLDGVVRTHAQLRPIWASLSAEEKLGLNITSGPHKDTQQLRTSAFGWFNYFLKDHKDLIESPAQPLFTPQELKVFKQIPEDEKNTTISETFVKLAEPKTFANAKEWAAQRDRWKDQLKTKSFRGWPNDAPPRDMKLAFTEVNDGIQLSGYDFTSEHDIRLRLYVASPANAKSLDLVVLNVLNDESWNEFLATMQVGFAKSFAGEDLPEADAEAYKQTKTMFQSFPWAMAYIAPRGIGPTAFDSSAKKQIQNRRRFYLLGQTLEGMQTWDTIQAAAALRDVKGLSNTPLWLQSEKQMAGVTAYASLHIDDVTRIDLHNPPANHRNGPYYLNVRRILDMPQAIAMAAERSQLVIYDDEPANWRYVSDAAKSLNWDKKQFQVRKSVKAD
ncbi:MAG: prolyl oligopeptidase family serine peptidase [bacterium]|nr:prolyl oligopeptidase family serine peptidase [bacterium]